jgi:hypothetical protein
LIIAEGKSLLVFFFAVTTIPAFYYLWRAMQKQPIPLREMAALRFIEEGVDRAVETGKPVFMGPGDMAYMSGEYTPMTIAAMNVIRYTTTLCVQRGARPIFAIPAQAAVLPLIDGIYREVAIAEGKPEAYDRTNIYFWGADQPSYAAGAMTTVDLEKPALYVILGACSGQGSETTTGRARFVGAITVMGTPRYWMNPRSAFYSHCPVLGDDTYAVGALCTGDPLVASPIIGGDVLKLVVLGIMLLGFILQAAGLPISEWLVTT